MVFRASLGVYVCSLWLGFVCLAAAQSMNFSAPEKPRTSSRNWGPPDVDQGVPAVSAEVPCPLSNVLQGATSRAKEFVYNLQQFSATEQLEHVNFDKQGKPGSSTTTRYNYVAEIQEVRPGLLSVEEYRDGTTALDVFPQRLATRGTAGFALIFHPVFIDDFEMRCEGLAKLNGKSAWQLHFVQRADRPSRFRGYRLLTGWFPVKLKGRAWIATDTHNVLRIETDLLEPINAIPLKTEHLAIDYQSVQFAKRKVDLWLPQQVEIYMDFRGHRYYRRHSFSNFQLFAVDVSQQDHLPETR